MSVQLEANVNLDVNVVVEADEVEELGSGSEFNAPRSCSDQALSARNIAEIQIDVQPPEAVVEGGLTLNANVEENLVEDEQGGSLSNEQAHNNLKIVWLEVMIICIIDICIAAPYGCYSIYLCINWSTSNTIPSASAEWTTFAVCLVMTIAGVIMLIVSINK